MRSLESGPLVAAKNSFNPLESSGLMLPSNGESEWTVIFCCGLGIPGSKHGDSCFSLSALSRSGGDDTGSMFPDLQ